MTARFLSRAPGKLFLLGEYAVLDGCPAVLVAVNRYVEVNLRLGETGAPVVLAGINTTLTFAPDSPPSPHGPLRFAVAAYRSAIARLPEIARRGMWIEISSGLTTADGAKSGLGSSAAVSVAVSAALFCSAGRDLMHPAPKAEVFATALEAHRIGQGGEGSGADVAASTYGGLIAFEPQNGDRPKIQQFTIPANALFLAGWTGVASYTPARIREYRVATSSAPSRHAEFLRISRTSVDRFLGALRHGQISDVAVNEAGRALERFDDELALSIMTPRLRDLVSIARDAGAGAKPSGAGGGDCGIALTQTPRIADNVRAGWERSGIVPLNLKTDCRGVTVEHC